MRSRRRAVRCAIKPIKAEKDNLEVSVCRTCLSTKNLSPIFDCKDAEKRAVEFRLVTGLEIKCNDGLSQKICSSCMETLQNALQFRRTSKKSEKTLLSMANGIKVKKKYSKKNGNRTKRSLKIERGKKEEQVEDYSYDFLDNEYPIEYDHSNAEDVKPKKIAKVREMKEPKPVMAKPRLGMNGSAPPYQCTFCSKEFRMKATYKAHLRFHTHYCVCESCGKRCRNHNQLQEHKRARHGLGRIHKCAYCEYTSATKEALTIHERRHTGERPYVCDHCGATFHRRSNLVQHIAIHLPEKNFQCDMCPKRLKSRKFLQIHKHNAHTGKRYGYLCPVCEHRFEKPNKVRAHTRRVHGMLEGHGPIVRVQL
ncbi:unnamed protein product, partial [Iphiclides podalirius]